MERSSGSAVNVLRAAFVRRRYCEFESEMRMTSHSLLNGLSAARSQVVRSPYISPYIRSPYITGVAAAIATLALTAIVNRYLAKKAERENPPAGHLIQVGSVRLHYLDSGSGDPIVLLHGNGSMSQDFQSSGLIEIASQKYRVIAFDRPGFGHSTRPRKTSWTPEEQADLFHQALMQIGISRATILGHSWGTTVALALALKYPEAVSGLILASGYYYPTVRPDVLLLSGPAVPVVGDVISHTVSPLLSRLLWPLLMRKIFGPANVPDKFQGFPKEMTFRPSQIRASAIETALMIPSAFAMRGEYADLKMPVVIIAGEEDRLVDTETQSARLHRDIKQSKLRRVANTGHMVHQSATARVMAAIDDAVENSATPVRQMGA
jgi:pimeloyl-ACP methyl ester carboxylesterase